MLDFGYRLDAWCESCTTSRPVDLRRAAMKMAGRIEAMGTAPHYAGLTQPSKAGPVWTGKIAVAPDHVLLKPLTWRKPARIFVNSMSDLFHESVPDETIHRVFAVMALADQHTFQVLTKRPERMREYLTRSDPLSFPWTVIDAAASMGLPAPQIAHHPFLANVWLGVSVEDQATADARIPILLDTPAAVRWISAEPLLGAVDLSSWTDPESACESCDDGEGYGRPRCRWADIPRGEQCPFNRAVQKVIESGPYSADGEPAGVHCEVVKLDWVVVGGESGPGARPMHPDWPREIRDQCQQAGVPFLFKQWGEWAPGEVAGPNERAIDAATWFDERWIFERVGKAQPDQHIDDEPDMFRVGKARAGRLVDGVLHDSYPEAR
ncbi:DUF5131 family protein [Mongoliimonas terrestris]|uniref:DUF5131 family protein n=1 Tax=Mongoliimonas terrestris TaxID=1709001 RepID=UPI001587FD7B|nr:phage Gp37/Gp68 family protein [Mongoliimonas terrestris]